MKDFVQWTTPSPLWETAISKSTPQLRRAELARPAILRFATDSFMDDFLKTAANDPKKLEQYLALPETWRGVAPMPEAITPAPAFARNFQRLGLISSRKKARANGQIQTQNKFTNFANSNADKPLKLYQPAHQRFYMIAACLVCERPGLPDKIPNSGREEKVTYVIRRLFPTGELKINDKLPPLDSTWEEYAYIITDQGARWKKVANKSSLETGEEQQTLFSVNITEDDDRRRKIFAGVIPTGRREAYIAAGKFTEESATNTSETEDPNKPLDSRIYLMRAQLRDPWRNLLQTASHTQKAVLESFKTIPDTAANALARRDIIINSRNQIQTISWLILLDFADFLEKNMPRVWDAVNGRTVTPSLTTEEGKLLFVLQNTTLPTAFANNLKADTAYTQVSGSLQAALVAVKANGQIGKNLEAVTESYDRNAAVRTTANDLYPKFLFPLADAGFDPPPNPPNAPYAPLPPNPNFLLKTILNGATVSITPTNFKKTSLNLQTPPPNPKVTDGEDHVNAIAKLIEDVIKTMPQNQPLMNVPLASQTPMDMRQGWFVIRCVFERPLCGAIDPPVLSEPTSAFQIAGFFDPDAPARPIRIALPIDTTPAGLRKFDRNTAFMMSDLLCGQVNRMKGITFADLVFSILPFPFHKGLDVPDSGSCKDGNLSVGMMCSLSIPIITICALILLMIIVALLDFIFKWLPFLIFCFPLPGLKAKDE